MSVRVITRRQFSDGTTIDGNRIAGSLQDIERFVDEVPSAFVKNRYTESVLVSGWTPATAAFGAFNDSHPFMESDNGAGSDVTNRYRLKGYYTDDATLALDPALIWEQAFQPHRTVIIHAVDLIMAQDPGAAGVFVMGGGAAYPNYKPPNINDLKIQITIDAPFVPEDRSQNDMEINKRDFSGSSWAVSPVALSTPANNMLPALNGGGLSGFSVNVNDLNIPVSPYSRVRFAVLIPKYLGGSTGETRWTARPWANSVWSLSLTLLEPNDRA